MTKEKIGKKDERKIFVECTDEWLRLSPMGKQKYQKIESLETEALTRKHDLELENEVSIKRKKPMPGHTRFMKCCYKRKGLSPDLVGIMDIDKRFITYENATKTNLE